MLDAMEGTFPLGVVMLNLMDADGVDGEGDGGRGTNSGNACRRSVSNETQSAKEQPTDGGRVGG